MATQTPGQRINELEKGEFLNLGKVSPCGTLEARKLASGTMMYWRTTLDKKAHREPIGYYDSSAPPKALMPTARGFSITAATRAAETLAQAHFNHRAEGGHVALLAAKVETKRTADAAKHAAEKAKRDAAQYTLENLLNHYCDHLETLGRTSHKLIRGIFRLHIFQGWPEIAAMQANQVTGEQAADIMRRIVEAGHGRTSNKLRSYGRAAFQMAKSARSKASVPVHFKGYGITSNPFDETEPDASFNAADKNPLSTAELRTYWRAIEKRPGFSGAVLRLHLLTGGQRIEQLVGLLSSNVTAGSIAIWDKKGRPGPGARLHTVPLIPAAADALAECAPAGLYALSLNEGVRHLASNTMSRYAQSAAAGKIPGFEAKRIRSGVETLLASAGVSDEIRGRLQSHGVGGVQTRHYNAYDYAKEKRAALETLFTELNKETSD